MNMRPRFASLIVVLSLLLPAVPALHAKKLTPDQERAKIRDMRDDVLKELYQRRPDLKSRLSQAEGYAVFSNVGVNLIFASFAGGSGIVVTQGAFKDAETFMKMGSAGIGLGLGVKDFRAVFVFTEKDKLQAFIAKGWDFSGQADAAAKSDDKGAAAAGSGSILPGVEVYQLTKNGLALLATLQGTKYWKDRELN